MNQTGQRAYAAYCIATGGKTYDGRPLPGWHDLDAQRQAGWAAAELTPQVKPWWKSKTVWFNAICLMLAAAETQLKVLQGVLPGGVYAWLAFVLPVGNAALRLVTSTAVGK